MQRNPHHSCWDGCRGCISPFNPPIDKDNVFMAKYYQERFRVFNYPRYRLVFRAPQDDVVTPVYRWDTRHYDEIFKHGFKARAQDGTPEDPYYNLKKFINRGGVPGDHTSPRPVTHGFVSTSASPTWVANVRSEDEGSFFRYEIYVPGGIHIIKTMQSDYRFTETDEVTFPVGIAPRYIRSAQEYELSRPPGAPSRSPVRKILQNYQLFINSNFNPYPLGGGPPMLLKDIVHTHKGAHQEVPLQLKVEGNGPYKGEKIVPNT